MKRRRAIGYKLSIQDSVGKSKLKRDEAQNHGNGICRYKEEGKISRKKNKKEKLSGGTKGTHKSTLGRHVGFKKAEIKDWKRGKGTFCKRELAGKKTIVQVCVLGVGMEVAGMDDSKG